ncbi:Autophagy protein 7 [Spiromyces aspiralis]|uniref:Autophagy protein 7 n=1 Tax=Spiromyces aspiralis TaxID=68401 RepID=A0ACC1HWD9_9FUNG|nr:Autophagy protein 7 [Spiromyces aspiralis]
MESQAPTQVLNFQPLRSRVDGEFWSALRAHKLHYAMLSTSRLDIRGHYQCTRPRVRAMLSTAGGDDSRPSVTPQSWFAVDAQPESFNPSASSMGSPPLLGFVPITGHLLNTNTIEEFKQLNRRQLLAEAGQRVHCAIITGQATSDPALLHYFVLLSFGDLKKYRFFYQVGFPALASDPPDRYECYRGTCMPLLTDVYSPVLAAQIIQECCSYIAAVGPAKGCAFALQCREGSFRTLSLSEWESLCTTITTEAEAKAAVVDDGGGEGDPPTIVFIDSSTSDTMPGWTLRNVLAWARCQPCTPKRIRVLCFRDWHGVVPSEDVIAGSIHSRMLVVHVTPAASTQATGPDQLTVVGWDRGGKAKHGINVADLSSTMDPYKVAETSLDLNLKLMRWRVAPDVQLERIAATKCLLLGAGTLGCYVARTLLGWGIRHVTFVDGGKVTFSNPPRQPLFEFDDCLDGGRPKAECAAEKLRRIFPGVTSRGYNLSIPMPGHPMPPSEVDKVRETVTQLDALVAEHDAVFLLTDSRESRWLPTLLGTKHRKRVLCAALGFESFVAMRHGVLPPASSTSEATGVQRLGCYFCNDVVAPQDSLSDRTLDQQCTVTRPGVAPVAAALAVELLVSWVQSPEGLYTAADNGGDDTSREFGSLGRPPHQIRGYLSDFGQHKITGQAYDLCTACSPIILNSYEQDGFDFLQRVFDNMFVPDGDNIDGDQGKQQQLPLSPPPGYNYLESLTGLAKLHQDADALLDDMSIDDEDDTFEDDF